VCSYLLPLEEEDEAIDGLQGAEGRRVQVIDLLDLGREGGREEGREEET